MQKKELIKLHLEKVTKTIKNENQRYKITKYKSSVRYEKQLFNLENNQQLKP